MGRFQFSLLALFGAVTVAAFVLAALLYIPLAMVVTVMGLMIGGAFLGLGAAVLVFVALFEHVVTIVNPVKRRDPRH